MSIHLAKSVSEGRVNKNLEEQQQREERLDVYKTTLDSALGQCYA